MTETPDYQHPPVAERRVGELIERPIVEPRKVGPLTLALRATTTALTGTHKATRGDFARRFLEMIEAPVTTHTLVAMMAWMQAEGDAGKFNPINSTHTMPGSTSFNWVHVQNYVDLGQGVEATAMTLDYGANRDLYGYRPIRSHLRDNSKAMSVLKAVEESSWGTGGLCVRVLEETGWSELMTNRYLHHRLSQ
jgi:hypothetical protein